MQHQRIHPRGPEFSRMIAGVWNWADELINERCITAALDCGITTFDHADIYGRYTIEELFGRTLKQQPGLRNKMQLVTKCGIKLKVDNKPEHRIKHYDTSYEHIIQSVETSLKNLGTDRIDLLLIHRPDPLLNPHEVAKAFSDLYETGKVLHFGVSNFTSTQFEMLQSFLPMPLITNQLEVSLFKTDYLFNGMSDVMMKHHAGIMAWSPLGSGKYFDDLEKMQALGVLADKYQVSTAQLLFAWLLAHPANLFPITGTTKIERIQEAATAIDVKLDKQDWFAMVSIIKGFDVA